MFPRFDLTLQVNHACNLRCDYCYTGAKTHRPMPDEVGRLAIDRAVRSIQVGGELDLGFFGGEPLLEAARIQRWIRHARCATGHADVRLQPGLTTNGTVSKGIAWELMLDPQLDLAISCDGPVHVHDRHRRWGRWQGSAAVVHWTLQRLLAASREFEVVLVVRPDTVPELPSSLYFLWEMGVRRMVLSLDLWTRWTPQDLAELAKALRDCANLWRDWLPHVDINWFSEKAAALGGCDIFSATARCCFGVGQVAVAPSGRLYPCERVIGEDNKGQGLALPGTVWEGTDFLEATIAPKRNLAACHRCVLRDVCGTQCRCSNFIRTGRVDVPDRLLCEVEKICARETVRVLGQVLLSPIRASANSDHETRSQTAIERTACL